MLTGTDGIAGKSWPAKETVGEGTCVGGYYTTGGVWRGGEDLARFVCIPFLVLICNLNLIDCKSFSRIAEREVFLFVTLPRFNRNCCNSVEVVLLDC